MSAAAPRLTASSYARRLARERGVPLAGLAGSGPNGRVVAADVVAFVAAPAVQPAAAPVSPPAAAAIAVSAPVAASRSLAAFQATVDLQPLAALIAAAGSGLAAGPFLVKAAARAAGPLGERLLVRDGGRLALVEGAATLSPGTIAARLEAGASGDAPFSIELLVGSGIRPMAGGLPVGAVAKLVIVMDAGRAELLFVHDEAALPSTDAVAILTLVRDLAEAPLRLLV
mgnify:CR=1 FL=1